MARRTALLAAMLMLLASCGEWTHFRAGPDRSGYNPLEATIGPDNVGRLASAWAEPVGPAGDRSPVVTGGKVFVAVDGSGGGPPGRPAVLYAKDAASGAHRWSQSYAYPNLDFQPSLTVAAVGDTVYAARVYGTDLGALYAYDAADGESRWTSSYAATQAPTVANGKVYARYARYEPGLTAGFAAWDAATGTVLFRSVESPQAGGIAVSNGTLFLAQGDRLEAYDASGVTRCSGGPPRVCTPLWSGALSSSAISKNTPAVANGVVYIASYGNRLHAFAAAGCGATLCAPLWTGDTGSAATSAAIAYGTVYVGGGDGRVRAFDASGCATSPCSPLWSAAAGGAIQYEPSSPGVANGVVYVGSDDSKLYAFAAAGCDHATCSALWSAVVDGGMVRSSPAIAAGRVFVTGGTNLTVYALAPDDDAQRVETLSNAFVPFGTDAFGRKSSPPASGPPA